MTAAALLPFGGLLWLDSLLKKYGPTQKAVDRRTGAEVEIAWTHTFMFVPVNWWAYIWLGLAICAAGSTLFYS
jgi:hypothetical protein